MFYHNYLRDIGWSAIAVAALWLVKVQHRYSSTRIVHTLRGLSFFAEILVGNRQLRTIPFTYLDFHNVVSGFVPNNVFYGTQLLHQENVLYVFALTTPPPLKK